jgi:mono/diheme cytochrome c family protein
MKSYTLIVNAFVLSLFCEGSMIAQGETGDKTDVWSAPSGANSTINPIQSDVSSVEPGKVNYEIACMVCHGQQGKGDGPAAAALERKPGDLSNSNLWNQSDGELFWKINHGRNPMPPFNETFAEKQVWELINYVRTLAEKPVGWVPHAIPTSEEAGLPTKVSDVELDSPPSISGISGSSEGPVSRVEYQKLLQNFAALQRQMEQLQKHQTTAHEKTEQNLDHLKSQVNDVAKEADANKSGTTKTLIAGYADAAFTDIEGSDSSFGASFNPLFHWKPSDKLLLTGELELVLAGNETDIGLEYAHMSYLASDYVTVGVGKFLTPFGTFSERLHPSWINKLPDQPLSLGHGGIAPSSSLGAQIRGGFPAGPTKLNWALYVSNGPKLNIGDAVDEEGHDDEAPGDAGGDGDHAEGEEDDHGDEGETAEEDDHDENLSPSFASAFRPFSVATVSPSGDAHGGASELGTLQFDNNYDSFGENKAVGGRFGILPTPAFEMGYSWMYGRLNSEGTSRRNIDVLVQGVDLSYTKNVDRLKGIIDARAQWNWTMIGDTTYTTDDGPLTFDNTSFGGYGQLAYRPSQWNTEWLRDCEFVCRWDMVDLPSGLPGEVDQRRWTFGVNYWINPSTVVKAAYQTGRQENSHGEVEYRDGVLLQAAMGF